MILVAPLIVAGLAAQARPTSSEWRTYGADLASTRYAPLDQINAANFGTLEVAWRFKTDNLGPRPEFNFQSTPLVVGGVLYTTAGSRRAVVALDAATGEMKWMHSLDEAKRVVRNHRLWELFLTQEAKLASDHVHADAEYIEHVLPKDVLRRLEQMLDHPAADPHGKPIPRVAAAGGGA